MVYSESVLRRDLQPTCAIMPKVEKTDRNATAQSKKRSASEKSSSRSVKTTNSRKSTSRSASAKKKKKAATSQSTKPTAKVTQIRVTPAPFPVLDIRPKDDVALDITPVPPPTVAATSTSIPVSLPGLVPGQTQYVVYTPYGQQPPVGAPMYSPRKLTKQRRQIRRRQPIRKRKRHKKPLSFIPDFGSVVAQLAPYICCALIAVLILYFLFTYLVDGACGIASSIPLVGSLFSGSCGGEAATTQGLTKEVIAIPIEIAKAVIDVSKDIIGGAVSGGSFEGVTDLFASGW